MSKEQKEKFYEVIKKYYEIGTTKMNVSLTDVIQELESDLTVLIEKK
ncbi:hypothetical protein [Bacillus sp. CECT 9360]|nr:hypothetical protein [Bacillus sp. CECT 9360]CAH0345146.1 hypothetical protein BCI9360_01425 [Bacillus sp. CECT 9360]